MAISSADIVVLSRLLDEALAMNPSDREAWLAALPAAERVHERHLREMLDSQAGGDSEERLASLPCLGPDDEVARSGELIGPYRLLHEIGRGGMGSVWLAERADGRFKRQVALKLPRLAWGAGLAERMAREREIGMLLEHPSIARLYDAGLDDHGRPYLALEYIDGQPLDAWCEAQALDVRSRLRLFVQVVRAVAYAHGRLVVHRDLKPSNVLVSRDGQAHLLDFGIAKLLSDVATGDAGLTQQQGRVLTPHYAAPEQVAGQPITVACDVYSLGVLLYEVLTGTLPIAPTRGTPGAVEDAILAGDAPLASSRVKDKTLAKALRGEIDAILSKAMQREPGRRYATADALAQDIERFLNGETVAARPDSVAYRLRKSVRRHWIGVSAAAAVLVSVLTGSGVAVLQAQRAARSAERERMVKEFVADVFRINRRVDPKNAALRPASPQSLLEGGAQLIQQRFSGQPELQAELYGVVGGVFFDMGAYKLAADYATRQIEALALLRADESEQAKALLILAQALLQDRKFSDAELHIKRARELAPNDEALVLQATVLLGHSQDRRGKPDDAASTLSAAQAMLAQQGPGPSTARALATSLRASLMAGANHLDAALPVYQQAIDEAESVDGALATTAIDIRLQVSYHLSQTNRNELAREYFDAGYSALRKLGGAHEVRAAFESARFAERLQVGGWGSTAYEAITTLESSRASLLATPLPIPDWWIAQIDFWLGTVKLKYGDIGQGLALVEASTAALLPIADSLGDRMFLNFYLGRALQYAGRHDRADTLLREGLAARQQLGEGNHPWAADDYFVIAQNLMMHGRTRDAEAVLGEAPHFEPIRGEAVHPNHYSRLLVLLRVDVRLAADDASGALRLLENSAPVADELNSDLVYYNLLLGEALCATGRSAEGLPLLKRQVVIYESAGDFFPHSPWLARLRAVTGQCALSAGDRAAARGYAIQARAAFTAQPGVSPYFKAPLFKLERALGLRLPPV